jgi:hypothetical protein
MDPRRSIVVASIRQQGLPASDTGSAPSILRLATIQSVEGKQDLADLAPKDGFIPAEPVEREVGQIGEAQRARSAAGSIGSGLLLPGLSQSMSRSGRPSMSAHNREARRHSGMDAGRRAAWRTP